MVSLGSTQDLDDLDELVDSTLPWEYGLAEHELCNDAADGPDIDLGGIIRVSKDQFGRSIVPRANIGDVGLSRHKVLSAPEIAHLKDVRVGIHQDILRLDISVTDSNSMNIGQRANQLVGVNLD